MPTPISSVSNCNARRQTLKKLVPQTGTSRLVQVTCTCVSQSANLVQVFLVQVSCTQLSTALFQHSNCPARDTNRATWLAGELFWYKKTVMNLRQIFRASFWYQFLKSFLSMCHRHNDIIDTTLHSKNKITTCKSPSAKIFWQFLEWMLHAEIITSQHCISSNQDKQRPVQLVLDWAVFNVPTNTL